MNLYGTYNPDGSIATWPETDINGRPYNRPPAATMNLSDGKFVVLPANYTDDGRLLAMLKPTRPERSASKKSDDDDE